MNRGSRRYQQKERNDAELPRRLLELAGYRRLHRMLRQEKWLVIHKQVDRLHREEGLAMRRREACQKRFKGDNGPEFMSQVGSGETSPINGKTEGTGLLLVCRQYGS